MQNGEQKSVSQEVKPSLLSFGARTPHRSNKIREPQARFIHFGPLKQSSCGFRVYAWSDKLSSSWNSSTPIAQHFQLNSFSFFARSRGRMSTKFSVKTIELGSLVFKLWRPKEKDWLRWKSFLLSTWRHSSNNGQIIDWLEALARPTWL